MHSVLAVDKNGNPSAMPLPGPTTGPRRKPWNCGNSPLGKKLYAATGTPIHPDVVPLVKIAWIRQHDTERFRQTVEFLSIKSYIIHQLTGEYLIDYSIASATGSFNIHAAELPGGRCACNMPALPPIDCPAVAPVFATGRQIEKSLSAIIGVAVPNTKILIGSSDGCLATPGRRRERRWRMPPSPLKTVALCG